MAGGALSNAGCNPRMRSKAETEGENLARAFPRPVNKNRGAPLVPGRRMLFFSKSYRQKEVIIGQIVEFKGEIGRFSGIERPAEVPAYTWAAKRPISSYAMGTCKPRGLMTGYLRTG